MAMDSRPVFGSLLGTLATSSGPSAVPQFSIALLRQVTSEHSAVRPPKQPRVRTPQWALHDIGSSADASVVMIDRGAACS